jgi:hypothetical protein
LSTKLIQRVRITREYAVVGEANSSSPAYWDRDFRETDRVLIREEKPEVVDKLREMTPLEQAMLSHGS